MVTLTLACADYERVHALLSGAVRPDGLDLRITTLPSAEILERMATGAEFDAVVTQLESLPDAAVE